MSPRRTVLAALALALLLVSLPLLFVFAADPCHIFHRPLQRWLPHGFAPLPSCQIAGLINTYLADEAEGFDAIILGSSLSENYRPEYFSGKMGVQRALKLTMVGAVPREINAFARHALRTGRVKRVFWEVSPYFFHMPDIRSFDDMDKKGRIPPYLYNAGRIDDYRYLFNVSTLSGAWDILHGAPFYIESIDRMGYWENQCASLNICNQFYAAEDIAAIQAGYQPVSRQAKAPEVAYQQGYADVDRFLLDVIAEHCNSETQFDLIIPPISLLWYARLAEADFDFELFMPRYVLEKTQACHNVRVFAFANQTEITADLSNYHDPRHFYGDVHDRMVDEMAAGRRQVTKDNVRDFEESLARNVSEYRPYGTKLYPH